MSISIHQAPEGLRHLADVDGRRYEVMELVIHRAADGSASPYCLLRDWSATEAGKLAQRDATIRELEAQLARARERVLDLERLAAPRAIDRLPVPAPVATVVAAPPAPEPVEPTPAGEPMQCRYCQATTGPSGAPWKSAAGLAVHELRCPQNPERQPYQRRERPAPEAAPSPLAGAPAAE